MAVEGGQKNDKALLTFSAHSADPRDLQFRRVDLTIAVSHVNQIKVIIVDDRSNDPMDLSTCISYIVDLISFTIDAHMAHSMQHAQFEQHIENINTMLLLRGRTIFLQHSD